MTPHVNKNESEKRRSHRGRELLQWMFTLALSGYNLLRISRMIQAC